MSQSAKTGFLPVFTIWNSVWHIPPLGVALSECGLWYANSKRNLIHATWLRTGREPAQLSDWSYKSEFRFKMFLELFFRVWDFVRKTVKQRWTRKRTDMALRMTSFVPIRRPHSEEDCFAPKVNIYCAKLQMNWLGPRTSKPCQDLLITLRKCDSPNQIIFLFLKVALISLYRSGWI